MKFLSLFGEVNPVFEELNERARLYAREKGFDYEWLPQNPYDKEAVIEALSGADVGLIDVEPYDASVFTRIVPTCKLLVRFGVGFDAVNLKDATESGIAIARTAGANAPAVAEMALSLILAARRQLFLNRKVVESGVWEKNVTNELIGGTVGIAGFGAIGRILARLVEGFQCRVLIYDPGLPNDVVEKAGYEKVDFETLLRESDAISIHVPYMKETHHMFNDKAFDMMKESAILVCTARGNIIDEDALYTALKEGKIAGAGLDVYSREPYPADGKLLELDNLVLTPHVSSQTKQSLWNIYKKAIDIAADFFAGRELSRADLLNPEYKNS